MTQHFVTLLMIIAVAFAVPAQAQGRYELKNSLSDRAKWRSFGVKDWVSGDPVERARAGRARIEAYELDQIGGNSPTASLKSLIALAEAGPKGYDAVHIGGTRRPPKRPTQMQLRDILAWIKATPGQPHAIGRYQFIPTTLRLLMKRTGTTAQARFSPALQDKFADVLLADAGYADFRDGRLSRKRFMNNLAKIWAGLPNHRGKSHYDGYAGNRATITRSYFEQKIREFYPT
jgi:muramidase (phage lysozyme)